MREGVLEQIWRGAIRPAGAAESKRVRRMFQALIPARCVLLKGPIGAERAKVLHDEMELMPELTLGDVIVEELSIDAPYGSVIMILDDDSLSAPLDLPLVSYDLGVAVARALLDVLRMGIFPLERENEALYVMACSYDRMARATGMRHLGLDPAEFGKGLAGTLGAYWSGARLARTDQTGLLLDSRCLAGERLRDYLQTLDPGFAAPEYDRLPNGLLCFAGANHPLSEWLEMLRGAVNGVLGKRTHTMDWEMLRLSKGI